MANYIQDCITNKCKIDEIDDYIDYWHESQHEAGGSDLTLAEFLGMTEEEYSLYIKDSNNLNEIIHKRRQQMCTELQTKTGAHLLDCRRALNECYYNLDKASVWIENYFKSGKILF